MVFYKKALIMSAFTLLSVSVQSVYSQKESLNQLADRVFHVALSQYSAMDSRLNEHTMPQSINPDNSFMPSSIHWWCSGFYPGSLWYIYQYTKDKKIMELAIKNTLKLDSIKYTTDNHDVGFMINCSYGNAYRLTGKKEYADVIVQASKSLSTRFSPVAGVIKSWDKKNMVWKCPVIIDNMMNLELLENATHISGDKEFDKIARRHADTTLKNHFRKDYSSYHLVDYDPSNGHIIGKQTVQGFSNESMWSRGQAWALYGYTVMYEQTKDIRYLHQAESISRLLLKRLPEDGIPLWDFDAPKNMSYKDVSAGAIMASAFVKLSKMTGDKELSNACLKMAEKQVREEASSKYMAPVGENFNFILMHSVGNLPKGTEIDKPLTYADYYFLEAILRLINRI